MAWSQMGSGALLPGGGVGSLAVGGWLLHLAGMSARQIVRRSSGLFFLTSAINVLWRSLVAHQRYDILPTTPLDMVMRPPIPPDIDVTDFDRHTDILAKGFGRDLVADIEAVSTRHDEKAAQRLCSSLCPGTTFTAPGSSWMRPTVATAGRPRRSATPAMPSPISAAPR